jgi:hypothetical protein
MKNSELAKDFAFGSTEGKGSNMFIDGRAIYSYGYHFPIAFRLFDGVAIFNQSGYSNSTSRHKGYVARALQSARYRLEFVNTEKLKQIIDSKVTEFKDIILNEL